MAVPCSCECCKDGKGAEITTPKQFEVSFSGVINRTPPVCTVCANFNATWTLNHRGACTWDSGDSPTACGTPPAVRLSCDGTNWVLTTSFLSLHAPEYKLAKADFNCLGSNVMPLQNGSDPQLECLNWPSSVTVTAKKTAT